MNVHGNTSNKTIEYTWPTNISTTKRKVQVCKYSRVLTASLKPKTTNKKIKHIRLNEHTLHRQHSKY